VEEIDIVDLRDLVAKTDNVDLRTVASALEQASGHHLNAFVRTLASQGVTYVPQALPPAAYEEIVKAGAPMGRGRGRGGFGPRGSKP
jgi:hypothetical protein